MILKLEEGRVRDRLDWNPAQRLDLGIDTAIPEGRDRQDRMKQFKAAWERLAADEAHTRSSS